ncbi:MAG: DUF882 domain-containing protein [Nitratireductor sp.]
MLNSISTFLAKFALRVTARRLVGLSLTAALAIAVAAPAASAETRTLKLYYLHTGEKTVVTFKKDGKYLSDGLKKANWALRDWRRNEPTKMDPRLLDLVWEAYQRTGSKEYVHVISGYRAPETNSMLRQRGRGVAKNSQHMLGRAMDFFLPDVKLSKIREVGLKMEVGGVGYYPTSGSPFVHLDVGNVRHWPRMSRTELARVFPDGKTIHVPSDGKPLPGYEQALAAYKARKGRAGDTQIATADEVKKPGFFASLIRRQKEDQQDDEESNTATLPRTVKTTAEPAETVIASAPPGESAPAATAVDNGPVPPASVEPQVAMLVPEGSRVPIPTVAPRNRQTQSAGIELASAEQPQPGLAVPAASEPAPGDAALDPTAKEAAALEAVELASLPVPKPRPNRNSDSLAIANALRDRQNPTVAMLSPEEIENLRNSATPGPSPVVANQPDSQVLALATDGNASGATAAIETLATPLPRPASASLIPTQGAVPSLKPYHGPDARTLALALAPSDETRTSAADAIRALMQQGGQDTMPRVVATASTARTGKTSPVSPVSIMTADRDVPVSINNNPVGKLALAANRQLRSVSEISPPAFGVLAFEKGKPVTTGTGFVKTSSLQPIGKLLRATN